jgi:hypothetical protein
MWIFGGLIYLTAALALVWRFLDIGAPGRSALFARRWLRPRVDRRAQPEQAPCTANRGAA